MWFFTVGLGLLGGAAFTLNMALFHLDGPVGWLSTSMWRSASPVPA